MNTLSRFSQAQILIAALFAVVLNGEIPPETPVAFPSQMEALQDEFSEFFQPYSRTTSRLALACVPWIPNNPHDQQTAMRTVLYLTRATMRPAAAVHALAEAVSANAISPLPVEDILRDPPPLNLSGHRGLSAAVARKFGLEHAYVNLCWRKPTEMETAWHACRAELAKMRAAQAVSE